jgi:hypothetical protein
MDESLSLNDGNQAKIDEQATIVRKIEADVTSLKQDYTQTLNTAVKILAAAISIPVAAIVSGLVCQTLEVSHLLVRRQRKAPTATRRVLNDYAFNEEQASNPPSVPPRSHSPSVTEPSAGHRDTEVSQTPILEPTADEEEWEAVWSSHQPTETDDNNSSVTKAVPHGLPSGGWGGGGTVADSGYYGGGRISSGSSKLAPCYSERLCSLQGFLTRYYQNSYGYNNGSCCDPYRHNRRSHHGSYGRNRLSYNNRYAVVNTSQRSDLEKPVAHTYTLNISERGRVERGGRQCYSCGRVNGFCESCC